MPTVITQGAASAKGYGFGASAAAANYIEDVFSTYLYTGNGTNRTISNGIDLSTKGGAVWIKSRSTAANNGIFDTERGANKRIQTDGTAGQTTDTNGLNSFATDGFNLGTGANEGKTNTSNVNYVSWTFRKQAKFFDVVSFSTNGSGAGTFSHSLGSTPGCVFIKRTSGAEQWYVYHRSLTNPNNYYLGLNTTAAETNVGFSWITVSGTSCSINGLFSTSSTYVAYLFAHDAGGFGATGSDNVISCGTFTTDGSGNATVTLGYEPQWVLVKRTNTIEAWQVIDNMRGWPVTPAAGNYAKKLLPNSSAAEADTGEFPLTNTGFLASGIGASNTYIYIAIRRGPMKTPTSGTSVYQPVAHTGTGSTTFVSGVNFPLDFSIARRTNISADTNAQSRLQGGGAFLRTNDASSEAIDTGARIIGFDSMTGFTVGGNAPLNTSGQPIIFECFRRAPGFFDEVCYTGTGANRTVSHNLAAVPELMIVKTINVIGDWYVYDRSTTATKYLRLNATAAANTASSIWNNTEPTLSEFSLGTSAAANESGVNYVAYLFATCPGVSKVGSYTGNGSSQTINCGFTGGARFVLIKRTNNTGDWYVWDTARGIVAGNDPYLLLNSTAAEVTNTDYIDTYSAGFEISSTAPAAINANGGSFIFLAIA